MDQVAYLRQYESSRQCELVFNFSYKSLQDLEVKVSRPITDTIAEFVGTIKETVKKVIDQSIGSGSDEADLEKDITVCFRRPQKCVKGKIVLQQLFYPINQNVSLVVCNKIYRIFLNAPLLKQLKLPTVLYANFTVQPSKFHSLFTDQQASEYFWYKSVDKTNWKKVSNEYQYTIKEEDVGYYLKFCCILYNKSKIKGPTVSIISNDKVENIAEIPKCPFEERHTHTKKTLKGKEYRIVSYNILADKYVKEDEYDYCPPKALSIDYRKQLILNELIGYNADIICLQEVDNFQYSQYFLEKFRDLGYGGIYNRKGNRIPEGLACFYNKSRLKKIMTRHIVYSALLQKQRMFSSLLEKVQKNKELWDLFTRQATSLQVSLFKTNHKTQHLIVANTHLFYHPDANHVRLLQIIIATMYLDHIRRIYNGDGIQATVIFCGDFNSPPDKSLYKYMTSGTVDSDHEDMKKISDDDDMPIYNKFVFKSACGKPLYTNYTADFKGCLDYIFIEKDKFSVLDVVPMTSVEELQKYVGLPNEYFPSDHLALVVDVKQKT